MRHPRADHRGADQRQNQQQRMQPIAMPRAGADFLSQRKQAAFRSSWGRPEGRQKRWAVGGHRARRQLLERLQLLAGLKADRFAGWNRYFRAGARVSANASLPRADIKDPKTSEFNPLAPAQRALHALENGFHGHLRLRLGDARPVDYSIDDVQFNQSHPPRFTRSVQANPMIGLGLSQCQVARICSSTELSSASSGIASRGA